MASSWIQVGGSALSGGKAEKVGRVRCRRAGNVPVVLCRVVFMRLFSAGGRKPWGRVDISRMSPLASTGQCKWRTGVGVRRTSKDKVHFTFRGEVRWQLPLSPGTLPTAVMASGKITWLAEPPEILRLHDARQQPFKPLTRGVLANGCGLSWGALRWNRVL